MPMIILFICIVIRRISVRAELPSTNRDNDWSGMLASWCDALSSSLFSASQDWFISPDKSTDKGISVTGCLKSKFLTSTEESWVKRKLATVSEHLEVTLAEQAVRIKPLMGNVPIMLWQEMYPSCCDGKCTHHVVTGNDPSCWPSTLGPMNAVVLFFTCRSMWGAHTVSYPTNGTQNRQGNRWRIHWETFVSN